MRRLCGSFGSDLGFIEMVVQDEEATVMMVTVTSDGLGNLVKRP